MHNSFLKYTCERHSNNSQPAFTDVEIMTIYTYVVSEMQLFKIKQIHKYIKDHLLSWFPELPGY
ncbi:MAG: hypothetical protein KAI45_08470, partial [Melioribacteraceae bacterium]|nr:hypothetical protein [Melioribacteraceae bacterium]